MTTDNIKFYSLIEAFALIQSVIVFAMMIIIMVNTYISMDKSQISLVILMQENYCRENLECRYRSIQALRIQHRHLNMILMILT